MFAILWFVGLLLCVLCCGLIGFGFCFSFLLMVVLIWVGY